MTTTEAVDARAKVLEWITSAIDQGQSLSEATAIALDQILLQELAIPLLEQIGHEVLSYLWRSTNIRIRGAPSDAGGSHTRRVDLAALHQDGSVSNMLFKVEESWVTIGSMKRWQCEWLAEDYKTRATSFARRMKLFATLAERLDDEQTISEVFSEDVLTDMWKQLGDKPA